MLPLFDNYAEIELDLYRTTSNQSLLKLSSSKEELVGTVSILVADILQNIYAYSTFVGGGHDASSLPPPLP